MVELIVYGLGFIAGIIVAHSFDKERERQIEEELQWLRENGSPDAEIIDCRVY